MNDINRKLYLLRMLHNYTQAYIASRLDISPTAYLSLEQDASNITVKRLADILQVYDVSLLDFFSFTEKDILDVLKKGTAKDDIDRQIFRHVTVKMEALNKLLFQFIDINLSIEKIEKRIK